MVSALRLKTCKKKKSREYFENEKLGVTTLALIPFRYAIDSERVLKRVLTFYF